MKAEIIFHAKFAKPTQKNIVQILRRIFRKLKSQKQLKHRRQLNQSHSITVVFVSAGESEKLNFAFRKKRKPTDILSFAPVEKGSLGELVICPQVLRQQARENGIVFSEQLLYILIHGILHLLGYDHETSAREARIMYAIQDRIFEELRDGKAFS